MRYIDLSQTITEEMPVFALYPRVTIRRQWTTYADFRDAQGRPTGYASNAWFIGEHTGTHMDAPIHFNPQGVSLEHVRPDVLIGETVVVDVSHCKPDEYYSVDDILRWEQKTGERIKEDDIVLFYTGMPKYWDNRYFYCNHYPGLDKKGAELLRSRRVRAVGTDTINLDHPQDFTFLAHHTLLQAFPKNILVMENYCNLHLLPPRFWQICTILKVQGGDRLPYPPPGPITLEE
ncbi:MAG: cyclase family protein [Chloroflexi bacterium]|nr:cyclase family protein [Chloroflexota bacterium]